MTFTPARFALFFSMPLAPLDWANLDASRVQLVQMPLDIVTLDIAAALHSRRVRLILRVPEGSYYDGGAPERVSGLVRRVAAVCDVEAVIVGNEPEHTFRMDYGSPDWGQTHAFQHRYYFDVVRVRLQADGYRVVSPGWALQVMFPDGTRGRSISEDDPAVPGAVAWREITCQPNERYTREQGKFGYLSADANGFHEYQHGWLGVVDELRDKFSLKRAIEWWHKPIYINELGINRGSQRERMRAYIDIAEMLRTHPYGARVELLCPFVSNGDPGPYPHHWSPGYLLTDPAAYAMLGDYLAGHQ